MKSISPAKSDSTCRHAPHGDVKPRSSETIAIALNFDAPDEMALKIATRSAQIVSPYELFSILHPVKIVPSFVRSAAPTLNLEKGE